MNKIPQNIYNVKSTDHFVWILSQFPKSFDFWLMGCEYEYYTPDENVHIDINDLVKIIDGLLRSSLSELRGIYENNYKDLFVPTILFPIYNLNTKEVEDIISEINNLIDEDNNYLKMTGEIIGTIKKIEEYIFYQKKIRKTYT